MTPLEHLEAAVNEMVADYVRICDRLEESRQHPFWCGAVDACEDALDIVRRRLQAAKEQANAE